MASELFKVVEVNPNDNSGGGGCVCDERKNRDCQPPYAVFYATDMESVVSPNVVVCKNCVQAVLRKMEGDILAGGEVNAQLKPWDDHEEHERVSAEFDKALTEAKDDLAKAEERKPNPGL